MIKTLKTPPFWFAEQIFDANQRKTHEIGLFICVEISSGGRPESFD